MISRKTWEYADVFRDINSWHESIKGDEVDINEQMKEEEKGIYFIRISDDFT